MPLIINKNKLDQITFDEANSQFILTDADNKNTLVFDYISKVENDIDDKDYSFHLFENNYLDAESDIFQLYVNKQRIGWIFSINTLESNEHDQSDNKFLNRYKYVAFKKLLTPEKNIDIHGKNNLSDIYGNNTKLLLLSNEETNKINNFDLMNYLPSLANYGYFYKNEFELNIYNKFQKEFIINEFRTKISPNDGGKLKLFESNNKISENPFYYDLYTKYLKISDQDLARFHILYQVFEENINNIVDDEFTSLLSDYNDRKLPKNSFFEAISDLKNERSNINNIVSKYDQIRKNQLYKDTKINLERDCKELIEEHHSNYKKSNLGDYIYDVRNLIVHNYRKLNSNEDLIKNIVYELEIFINHIL